MTIQEIKTALQSNYTQTACMEIEKLSHAERIAIREELGNIELPRNLFFDYETQTWID